MYVYMEIPPETQIACIIASIANDFVIPLKLRIDLNASFAGDDHSTICPKRSLGSFMTASNLINHTSQGRYVRALSKENPSIFVQIPSDFTAHGPIKESKITWLGHHLYARDGLVK